MVYIAYICVEARQMTARENGRDRLENKNCTEGVTEEEHAAVFPQMLSVSAVCG